MLFLYISLQLLQDYDVKMPNFKFYGEGKQATTKFLFLSKLECGPKNSTKGKFAYNRHVQRIGISATKFEKR